MQIQTISRHNTRPARNVLGLILTITASVILAVLILNFPAILSNILLGIFGLFGFAIFGTVLFIGIMLLNHRQYVVKKQYLIRASIALFSFLAFIHLIYTAQFFNQSFAKFLADTFSASTPGGIIFSIVMYPIATIFTVIGTYIILAMVFVVGVFLVLDYFLSAKQLEAVLTKKPPQVPSLVKTPNAVNMPINDAKNNAEQNQVNILQAQYDRFERESRAKLEAAKSKLGLTRPPVLPKNQELPYGRPIETNGYNYNNNYNNTIANNGGGYNAGYNYQPNNNVNTGGGLILDGDSLNALTNAAATQYINSLKNNGSNPIIIADNDDERREAQTFNTQKTSSPRRVEREVVEGRKFPQPNPYVESNIESNTQTDDYEEDITSKELPKQSDYKKPFVPIVRAANNQINMDEVANRQKRTPVKKSARYVMPSIELIKTESTHPSEYCVDVNAQATALAQTLADFRIDCEVVGVVQAPAVTRYEIRIPANVNVSRIAQYAGNIKMNLACKDEIRIE
ncbi:MAG: DNA translocase FtsK 4TM domain-containing protein, partial [Firmicutes bacterium]|nr:DNA translocase FtsK 4TM domain-containing protein [Bacillota bacterium]